jgi:hypothetical protein
VFTHEHYISAIPDSTWRSILQGISNNLAAYKPIFVTLDYANQYVRATRTSHITSSQFDTSSGQALISLSGKTDLDTSVQVFSGNDNSISNFAATVPAFSNSISITTIILGPIITSQPSNRTNHAGTTAQFTVSASGSALMYQWNKNTIPISQATNSSLVLSSVSTNDADLYTVFVHNAYGTNLSASASLTVVQLVIQSLAVTNGTAAITWSALPA